MYGRVRRSLYSTVYFPYFCDSSAYTLLRLTEKDVVIPSILSDGVITLQVYHPEDVYNCKRITSILI